MNNILVVKKVGNHWYPCIKHNWTGDIVIPRKIELIFNIIAMGEEVLHLEFEELHSIVEGLNIIWFNDADITQYMITDDEDEFEGYDEDDLWVTENIAKAMEKPCMPALAAE